MTIIPTPNYLKELQYPWKSLVNKIPGLSPKMESEFRFGHRVSSTQQGYLIGGNIKGGSSGIWRLCSKKEYSIYQQWQKLEGIQDDPNPTYFRKLQSFLQLHSITLTCEPTLTETSPQNNTFQPRFAQIYQLTYEILQLLPPQHLQHNKFQKLQLGGWGPDSAKGSAYFQNTVIMYNFAIKGAKRTFLGLLLHEIGHSWESTLNQQQKQKIYPLYTQLCHSNSLIGLEYLLDAESRKNYQKLQLSEFLAENYLHYIVLGQKFLEYTKNFSKTAQKIWQKILQFYKKQFYNHTYS